MFNRNPFYSSFPGYGSLLKKAGFNWGGLLTGTQKTLGVINQAIPVFYQIKPVWNNAKTIFRVIGEMNKTGKTDTTTSSNNNDTTTSNQVSTSTPVASSDESTFKGNEPNFFA